jgi:hypothetical protein
MFYLTHCALFGLDEFFPIRCEDVEAYILKAVGSIFCSSVGGRVTDYCFHRLFGIWGECEIVEIIFSR